MTSIWRAEWKDVEGTLLEIAPDASGKCYQP